MTYDEENGWMKDYNPHWKPGDDKKEKEKEYDDFNGKPVEKWKIDQQNQMILDYFKAGDKRQLEDSLHELAEDPENILNWWIAGSNANICKEYGFALELLLKAEEKKTNDSNLRDNILGSISTAYEGLNMLDYALMYARATRDLSSRVDELETKLKERE